MPSDCEWSHLCEGQALFPADRPPWTCKGALGLSREVRVYSGIPGQVGLHTLRLQCGGGVPRARWGWEAVSPTLGPHAQGSAAWYTRGSWGRGGAYSSLGTGWTVSQTVSLGALGAAPLSLFSPTQPSRLGQRMRFCSRGAVLAPGLHKGSPVSFPQQNPL